MTKEEVKTFLPIMQAYVEGKQIQYLVVLRLSIVVYFVISNAYV